MNFLDELKQDIIEALDFADGSELDDDVVNKVFAYEKNQLGENARRMLEIGIVQDELVKLGFKQFRLQYFNDQNLHQVEFDSDKVIIRHSQICEGIFYYTSPTWQEDLLTKIKELINDK